MGEQHRSGTLWELVGYSSAHEHCQLCKECLFERDEVLMVGGTSGDFYHLSAEECGCWEEGMDY
jgi:hypothetical protein